MYGLTKKQILLVLLINSSIAFAYYFDNLNAEYSELSSDIQNIVPVAQKFDNPDLFKEDLYLNTIDNVKYYTPFYVQSLRFIAKFNNHDYVQAINVLGVICHLFFGLLWFFVLFKYSSSYWIALLISIMVRGVVWLPGLEIWGISDLWTIMPRTVYITLLPLPFILLSSNIKNILLSSFLIGLIFNFHPITGLGGVLLFLSLLLFTSIYFQYKPLLTLKNSVLVSIFVLLGMLPFIMTYFGKTSSAITYNPDAFNEAFKVRIPEYFSNPFQFLKKWISFKTIFYVLSLFAYFFITRRDKEHLEKSKLLLILTLILLVVPMLSVPIEHFVNRTFDLNLRLSFQLIRVQKVAIVPSFFAFVFLLKFLIESNSIFKKSLPYIFASYIILLIFSNSIYLKKIPFFGDDVSKSILPKNLSLLSSSYNNELAVDRMAKFIDKHTQESDLFCGSHIYRGATRRSVIFDGKGISMLIEGNPNQFIEWSQRQQKINNLNSMNDVVDYLKSFGVDYYVTQNTNVPAQLIHREDHILLYKL